MPPLGHGRSHISSRLMFVHALLVVIGSAQALHGQGAPLLVVGDGPDGSVPPPLLSCLTGSAYDSRTGGQVSFEEIADYRVVIWAAGANLAPFFHSSVKNELARYLRGGGSLLVTGDWTGQRLSETPHGDLVARFLRSSYTGRQGCSRIFGRFADTIGSGLDLRLEPCGVETFNAPIGPGSTIFVTDGSSGSQPAAVRAEGTDWPPYRAILLGFDIGRAADGQARTLMKRAMAWLRYPSRLDFERVVQCRNRPSSAATRTLVLARALVALRTEPDALLQLKELVGELGVGERKALAPLAREYRRTVLFRKQQVPKILTEIEALLAPERSR